MGAQEELNSFLSVAEDLKVKGLTQKKSDNSTPDKEQEFTERKVIESNNTSYSNHEQKRTKPEYASQNPPAPPKRPRPPRSSLPPPEPEIQEIEEIVPVKTEPVPAPAYQQVATMDHMDTVEEHAVDTYDGYEDDGYQYQEQDGGQYTDGQVLDTSKGNDASVDLQDYITKVTNFEGTKFSCTLCGKQNNQKGNLMKHVESVHFPNSFSHQCKYCDQIFYAKNNLYVHVSKFHKNKQ